MTESFIEINGRRIGPSYPTYLVAEISGNHRQDFDQATKLVKAAKEAGADAVKLQTYTADTLTIRSDKEYFQIQGGTLWDGQTLHGLYGEAFTPWEWQPRLKAYAEEIGLDCFSSAFDPTAVDFLEAMKVPAYKVASFEIVDLSLIEKIARTGKPIILSTGMATFDEIREAVDTALKTGNDQIALLKCTSAYPASPDDMNLRTIPDMMEKFGLPIGLSDHTQGIAVPVAAVSLGACMIEKHFTLDRRKGGPDSAFSLQPEEFRQMVQAVRTVERALGSSRYGPGQEELKSIQFRRSLFVVQDIRKGESFTEKNVRSIRPGYGLPPKYLKSVIGRKAAAFLQAGTPLQWDHITRENGGPF